jgi:hypothetical protein
LKNISAREGLVFFRSVGHKIQEEFKRNARLFMLPLTSDGKVIVEA